MKKDIRCFQLEPWFFFRVLRRYSVADIYRYQIVSEPLSPDALTLDAQAGTLFRYSEQPGFEYLALSTSAVVRRVATAMAAQAGSSTDWNAIANTPAHPGYHADSFQYKVGRCKLDPSLKATWLQPLNMRVHTVLST